MIFVLKQWRYYLYRERFKVFSDHKSLSFHTKATEPKAANGIEDYDFKLNYHPRKGQYGDRCIE